MTAEEVRALVEAGIDGAQAEVDGAGDKFDIRVVAAAFDGKRPVARQQLVYGCINERISDGSIHAVSIQTYTPDEWETASRRGLI
ncbi:MAG: BolA/IbaG family iron-sulfur metabolism protein [Alcanivoracaceae bacterium]|jgi:acid stress-induced BolA-like protein IbaG/YrbA|nr:BolA/IbaG family iron-sulfur metabolism protein [Alcanivoracaceae bacterium]